MEKFDFGRYPEQFFCLIIDGGKFKMQPTFKSNVLKLAGGVRKSSSGFFSCFCFEANVGTTVF